MKEKLKNYCEYEISICQCFGANPNKALDRCYGALIFVCDQFGDDNNEIGKWWDEEMLPRFRSTFGII